MLDFAAAFLTFIRDSYTSECFIVYSRFIAQYNNNLPYYSSIIPYYSSIILNSYYSQNYAGILGAALVWRCRPYYAARFFDYLAALAVEGSGHIRKLNLCELQQ